MKLYWIPFWLHFTSLSDLSLFGLVNSDMEEPPLLSSRALLSSSALFRFGSQRRRSLQTLDLSGCGLTDKHFQALQAAFSRSSLYPASSFMDDEPYCVLQNLHLQRNLATPHGLEALLPDWLGLCGI